MSWRDVLNPEAATNTGHELIDVTPLQVERNAFGYAAELFASKAPSADHPQRAAFEQQIQWLQYLAEHVPFKTCHPVVALTVAHAAANAKVRVQLLAALEGVHEITESPSQQEG